MSDLDTMSNLDSAVIKWVKGKTYSRIYDFFRDDVSRFVPAEERLPKVGGEKIWKTFEKHGEMDIDFSFQKPFRRDWERVKLKVSLSTEKSKTYAVAKLFAWLGPIPIEIGNWRDDLESITAKRTWVKTTIIPKVDIDAPYRMSHTIRFGDRIWYLADDYGYTNRKRFTEDVRKLNPGIDFSRLKPGQVINVPTKTKTPTINIPYELRLKQPQQTIYKPPPTIKQIADSLKPKPMTSFRPEIYKPPPTIKQIADSLKPKPMTSFRPPQTFPQPGSLKWYARGLA